MSNIHTFEEHSFGSPEEAGRCTEDFLVLVWCHESLLGRERELHTQKHICIKFCVCVC